MDPIFTPLLIGLLIVVAFQMLFVSPQKKKLAQERAAVEKLEPGTRIMTTFGVFATIVHMGDQQAIIEVAPGIEMTIVKKAIAREIPSDEEEFEYAEVGSDDADKEAFEQAIAGFNEPTFDPKADEADKTEDGPEGQDRPRDVK